MAKFNIRLINLGRIEGTGEVDAPDYLDAFGQAHGELMDPIIQCLRGEPVRWIEITPKRQKSADDVSSINAASHG